MVLLEMNVNSTQLWIQSILACCMGLFALPCDSGMAASTAQTPRLFIISAQC